MNKEIKELYSRIGFIVACANRIEDKLENFISYYFTYPTNDKTTFFRISLITKLGMEDKIKLFQSICKKENYEQKIVKSIIKNIRYVQKIRNRVAHWQIEALDDVDIILVDSNYLQTNRKIVRLEPKLLREIDMKRFNAESDIYKILCLLRKEGSFDTRSPLIPNKSSWDEYFKELAAFIEKQNRMPSISSTNKHESILGNWAFRQRQIYDKGKLKTRRFRRLDKIKHWYWSRKEICNRNIERLREFVQRYKRLPREPTIKMPHNLVSRDDKNLVVFSKKVRRRYLGLSDHKSKLTKKQIANLEAIPSWFWRRSGTRATGIRFTKWPVSRNYINTDIWGNNFHKLAGFVKKNKRLPDYKKKHADDPKLLRWIIKQRLFYHKNKLVFEQIDKLESVPGWYWNR